MALSKDHRFLVPDHSFDTALNGSVSSDLQSSFDSTLVATAFSIYACILAHFTPLHCLGIYSLPSVR